MAGRKISTAGAGGIILACALALASCGERTRQPPPPVYVNEYATGVDEARVRAADGEPGNWFTVGRSFREDYFSPVKLINEQNIGRLGLAWVFDLDTHRGQEATPLVVNGVMYFSTAWSKVKALDAKTGKLLWEYDPQVPPERAARTCCDVVNRGVALWNDKLYFATLDGRLIALKAATGEKVWEVQTTDPDKGYTITGAPRVAKGRVFIGQGGGDSGLRGYVSAYSATTGEFDWRFYIVPGDPSKPFENPALEKAAKTWNGEWWKIGGGGTPWNAMAYDPDLDLLYVGAGNAGPWNPNVRSPGGGDNLYIASIIALRPETGEYVWHFQNTPEDAWDFTATQPMILADLEIGGKMRKVIMQAPKNGFFYVLDRETGEFISAKPIAPVNWTTGLDDKGRPAINPEARYYQTGKTFISQPGIGGAHNWQPMSFNPETGLVYIPVMISPTAHLGKGQPQAEGNNVYARNAVQNDVYLTNEASDVRQAVLDDQKGYLLAWNPVTQTEAWRVDQAGPFNGGALSTAGNLVFEGTSTGEFNAYRATDGKLLWSMDAFGGIIAGPSSYVVDGEQYVAVLQGWGGGFAMGAGEEALQSGRKRNISRVLAFKLGGTVTLPEPPPFPELDPPPATAKPDVVATGERLYQSTCSRCHGGNAVAGGTVPDLRYSAALNGDSWYDIVLDGILKDTGMIPFKGSLSREDANAIRAYVIAQANIWKAKETR